MLRGDGWRTRHDAFKWLIAQQASWAMYHLQIEPSNVFLPWIRQREHFLRSNRKRQRQGMVPDFIDVDRQVLMDVKGVSYCNRYRPPRFFQALTCDVVRERQAQVQSEALRKAKKVDTDYNGFVATEALGEGPMEQRLRSFGRVEGLVVGAHGEGSPDLLRFIKLLAERAAMTRFRSMGFDTPRSARSTILGQIRMSLGVEAIRGMARLRVANLGTALAGNASSKTATNRRYP